MRLDSHQHFWNFSEEEYDWIDPDRMAALRRNFTPSDLEAEQSPLGFDGSIAVQARQTIDESRWLLSLADASPRIKGVVGWVDLRADTVDEQLSEFSQHPKFSGVRHVVQDEPDDRFVLNDAFRHGIGRLKPYGLTYDLLVYPRHLPAVIELVESFPEQSFVLDHIAKPFIREGTLDPWRDHIKRLAAAPHCFCKVSGLITEGDWNEWKPEDFKPYLDTVFEAFGVNRLMFGSDWPVCLVAGTYQKVYQLIADYLSQFNEADQARIFGDNAARFYCVS